MKKAWIVALAAALALVATPGAADAGVKFNGKVIYVVPVQMPSDWPIKAAVDWLDQYTGSDMRISSVCRQGAHKCVYIKNGRVSGPTVGWSSGRTITIDTWKAKNVRGYAGYFNWTTKRWLLAHELGHQFSLPHRRDCRQVMDDRTRCGWPSRTPPLKLNTWQRNALRTR